MSKNPEQAAVSQAVTRHQMAFARAQVRHLQDAVLARRQEREGLLHEAERRPFGSLCQSTSECKLLL